MWIFERGGASVFEPLVGNILADIRRRRKLDVAGSAKGGVKTGALWNGLLFSLQATTREDAIVCGVSPNYQLDAERQSSNPAVKR